MIDLANTDTLQIEILANEIAARLKDTGAGHCARVDFLSRNEAFGVCQYIQQKQLISGVAFHLLTSNNVQAREDAIYITTDKAIEIRNRKQEQLCLFIAADLVDAASSSIANSFALIDGRELHNLVLRRITDMLSPEFAAIMRAVFSRLRGLSGNNNERRLDFALALLHHMQTNETTSLGLELWRIGLIADSNNGFLARLDRNRECTLALSRPNKLGATTRERIQSIKVDTITSIALENFFRKYAMNDVRIWSQALAKEPTLTFDRWIFPAVNPSDLQAVNITPFKNATTGEVESFCRLAQPDGAKGNLLARYGAKESLIVRWKTDPILPKDIDRWRIGIVPVDDDSISDEALDDQTSNKFDHALYEISIAGKRRNITIRLDMDFEEPPDYAVCVRIMPLSADGREILHQETLEPIFDNSQEFFLVKDVVDKPSIPSQKSILSTPTLAFGRIEYLVNNKKVTQLSESDPEWLSKDLEYFRVRLNEKDMLNVGVNRTLLALEKRVLADPRQSGCFVLDVDEIRIVKDQDFQTRPLQEERVEYWAPFWRARETFFKRLHQSDIRSVIEVVDWTPELAASALRYAQIYHELIDKLIDLRCSATELREALSLDTLLIRYTGRGATPEESLIILPTHPLRAAWFASYAQLLREWEKQLLSMPTSERGASIDLQTLRLLAPVNVPAFAYHAESATTFTFFQNLRFFYGVSLPTGVPDPYRRFSDIAHMLDTRVERLSTGDVQPEQLTTHLKKFHTSHPYAETLVTTLLNPERGNFFAEAIKQFIADRANDENISAERLPTFQVVAYTEDRSRVAFDAFEQVRQQQVDQQYGRSSDHFLPGLTVTTRDMSRLDTQKPALPEAHIAVVTDFTRPEIVPSPPQRQDTNDTTSSFSLYGLINRFVSQFTIDNDGLLWRHSIVTEGIRKPEPHPAGPRYTETCLELHTSLLYAGGYLLGSTEKAKPVLEVRLDAKKRDLLERLHTNTNWVVTLDRFFTLDYYDSPHQPGLDNVAKKYVLDYSPDFTDGLGHRMMVTTAWHEEIESLLSQAMDELGFSGIDESVSHLLHYLKTISGRLALDAIESSTNAAAAVGLGVVTAWLQKNNKLRQAVLIPVDIYPRMFSTNGSGKSARGERRCDLVLVSLKRNIVEATFIEVKWRRGNIPLEQLAEDMVLQMEGSAQAMRSRFFDVKRIDGALQRSYLANVLRFYFERSRRYKLFDSEAETSFLEHITRLEKTGLEFRATYEGYVVKLDDEPRNKPLLIDTAKITLLTARDFTNEPMLLSTTEASSYRQSNPNVPVVKEESSYEVPIDLLEDDEPTEKRLVVRAPEHALAEQPMIADANLDSLPATNIEARKNDLPQESLQQVAIPLGETSNVPVVWEPGVKGSPHLFVLGIPGQGKSWTVTRILSELAKQSVPALVLDFHGQFADPQGEFVQVAHPHVLDAAKGLPFSPFECTRENGQGGWMENTLAMSEIFAYVANLGEMQKDVVYTSIRDAYKARGFSIDNEEMEKQSLTYPTLNEVMKHIEENERLRHISNVTARCRPLLEMNLFRPTENSVDLLTLVRNGLVIDLHNLFAETLQMATGAFMLRKIYKDMFRWGYADRLKLAIVLDEAHRLAKDITLPKLMKEGRKFGISVVVASQGLGDFHPDVLNNAGTKVIFRMNYPESRKVSGFIRTRQGQELSERIEQLPVGSAYVQTPDMAYGSAVKMYPL